MVSSTRDQLTDHLAGLPEEYFALSACFISAVHHLASGNASGHEERLQRMADSYFVLVLECIREDGIRHFVSPGIIRYMAHKVSVEELSAIPHRGDVVEMVYQQFEERLWLILREVFEGVISLPTQGPVDLLTPVLGMLLTEQGASVLSYDDIPSLKKSAAIAIRSLRSEKVLTAIFTFMESMISMTEGKAASSVSRTRSSLTAFLEQLILDLNGDFRARACALLNQLQSGSNGSSSTPAARRLN